MGLGLCRCSSVFVFSRVGGGAPNRMNTFHTGHTKLTRRETRGREVEGYEIRWGSCWVCLLGVERRRGERGERLKFGAGKVFLLFFGNLTTLT